MCFLQVGDYVNCVWFLCVGVFFNLIIQSASADWAPSMQIPHKSAQVNAGDKSALWYHMMSIVQLWQTHVSRYFKTKRMHS